MKNSSDIKCSLYDFRAYLDIEMLRKAGFDTVFRLGEGYM
jgi:hypothetical protein